MDSVAQRWFGAFIETVKTHEASTTLREALEFVEETVTALGYSTELAGHLFRECWAEGTAFHTKCESGSPPGFGSEVDLCRAFGWEVEAHKFKVAMAADLVALWHNGRITVDVGNKEVSGGPPLNK
jgi:hypothetical protein